MTPPRLPYPRLSDPELCACIERLQALLDAIDPTGPTAAKLHGECGEALEAALAEQERRAAI